MVAEGARVRLSDDALRDLVDCDRETDDSPDDAEGVLTSATEAMSQLSSSGRLNPRSEPKTLTIPLEVLIRIAPTHDIFHLVGDVMTFLQGWTEGSVSLQLHQASICHFRKRLRLTRPSSLLRRSTTCRPLI